MKIVHIVPGFGGTFYCGNCLRDSGVVASLKRAGHDAVTLPMYLPLTIGGQVAEDSLPVFYGAVNIFLKQYPVFRHMPRWFERLMDTAPVLKFAASKSGSTRASGLEDLTESMLMGAEGHQQEELQQLVDFLKHHEKPDIVHISNALLLGMAEQIRREVNVPVVCSLQDEDVWVDAMHENRREAMWQLLATKSRDVAAFIAVSDYFAGVMKTKMSIPEAKIHVVPIGVDPSAYAWKEPATVPRAIGYVSRLCPENGFEVLVDAFILLRKNPAFSDVRLHATGGSTGDDAAFIRRQREKLRAAGLENDFTLQPGFTQPELQSFLHSVTLLSVPVLNGEAFGLYQLEALACGVPLVQPALGAFPEIARETGGGVIYEPNTPVALAAKLEAVLADPEGLRAMSRAGRRAVEEKYNCSRISSELVRIYSSLR
jgi:glycosyltransferase involved in cell wall biosynthesis